MTVARPTEQRSPASADRRERRITPFSWLLLLLGTFGFAAFWVLFSVAYDHQFSWMAVFGALDIAWMLRLGGWRPVSMAIAIQAAASPQLPSTSSAPVHHGKERVTGGIRRLLAGRPA